MVRGGQWVVAKIARELGITVTGGSSSVVDAWGVLPPGRGHGARAAARRRVARAGSSRRHELTVDDGVVSHPSGARAHYGELAKAAAATPPGTVAAQAARANGS